MKNKLKDIKNKRILEKLYPIGSIYFAGFIWNFALDVDLESIKQMLPKIGEWKCIGVSSSLNLIFKRIN